MWRQDYRRQQITSHASKEVSRFPRPVRTWVCSFEIGPIYLFCLNHVLTFRPWVTWLTQLIKKMKNENEIWRTCPLYCHTHSTHTHMHMQVRRWWKVLSAFSHPGILPQGQPGAVGGQQCGARGPSPSARSWLGQGQDRRASALFACFYCWGSTGGTRVTRGRTCKLHTERPGNKPRHVAPCGTWTHDLLAVRQQCYALCHRAPNYDSVRHGMFKTLCPFHHLKCYNWLNIIYLLLYYLFFSIPTVYVYFLM